ncbi:rab6 GTPase activating protein [Trypanosoma grayi]|uniref:rab6 GTPase activating protein n=1 Tax=Trypanosoma grayi TaxID=71804 RepID=UPI0004F4217C|nr:rab6 GTPase activating protein [Trypanosoma grayi]KEG07755.1 rab6 GTPase activating protein [Trypanosoma grayi]
MSSNSLEVLPVRRGGPAAIDSLGFYLLSNNATPAPASLTDAEKLSLAQEEKFWTSRICCYLRLSLELQRHTTLSDGNNNVGQGNSGSGSSGSSTHNTAVEVAALVEAQRRVGWQMRRRVWQFRGVPHPTLRRLLWGFFSGALQRPASVVRTHHAAYAALTAAPPDEEIADVIQRDLGRTLPTHCLFVGNGSVGQAELRRILAAFSRLDPAVGYCQGMAFIAAVLLLHAPEEEAFAMLVQLFFSPLYRLRELYLPGFPLLRIFFAVLRRLIERLLPTLHRHFEDAGVDVVFFASQWFLTLYTYQFPLDFSCRVWDLFLVTGWRVMFQVAIAILQGEQEQLLALDMEATLLWLKECHEGRSTDEMLHRIVNVPLTQEDFALMLDAEGVRVDDG